MKPNLLGTFCHPEGEVSSVLFINGNRNLVTGGYVEGVVRIWDIPSGAETEVLHQHQHGILCMAASADYHWFATCGYDGMRVFDLHKWGDIPTRGLNQTAYSVAFDGQNRRIAVYYWALVQITDMESPEICSAQLITRGCDGLQALFTPGGTELILTELHYTPTKPVGCGNGSHFIQRVNIGTGQVMAQFGRSIAIRRFCVSPCGTLVAATGYDGKARVWDAFSGRQIGVIPVSGWAITFHPHHRVLAIGEEDSVTLWQLDAASPLAALKGASFFSIYDQLAFSPDGSLLAATGKAATLWAFDCAVTNHCPAAWPGL